MSLAEPSEWRVDESTLTTKVKPCLQYPYLVSPPGTPGDLQGTRASGAIGRTTVGCRLQVENLNLRVGTRGRCAADHRGHQGRQAEDSASGAGEERLEDRDDREGSEQASAEPLPAAAIREAPREARQEDRAAHGLGGNFVKF
ncbi:hypothetical protein L596_020378 [Steinernema carpocapsae]|uniref:Uncharacterized protein n=1 Tax=Steinernema carpocapsae TaxID=34508 RepID=A0A4U5MTJ6_STECR|nr:hypothetical protein L596_020378 [Steinernema carpocapsae]